MKLRVGGAIAAALVVAVAITGGTAAAKASKCGTVTLNEQAWAGSTANTYVVKNVLEKSLGCKVNISKVAEVPVYQAMADGKTDAILEDWGHVPQWNQYVTKQKTVVRAGANGVTGVIGWYVPTYLVQQHPELKSWTGLKKDATLFKSPESGSQGMFLGGDPSYQQKDKTLITALGLNLKFVSVGAEPAQVARWESLYKQKKPVLFYWYDPQYLNAQYDLVQVKLPPRFKGCQDDEKKGGDPKKYACAYPSYRLDKVISSKFAKSGSPAVSVIRKFRWTSKDQNTVANLISGKKMKPDKAAETWVKANPGKVALWLKK
jgi:glycine betaine/proline transport system substrate-binding protein